MKIKRNAQSGFTMIEIMVVVVIESKESPTSNGR